MENVDCIWPSEVKSNAFLGKLITPSVTPSSYTNPGYATFSYSNGSLGDLKMNFLQLEPTIGQDSDYSDFEWFGVNMNE